MKNHELNDRTARLITGLTDQEIRKGATFAFGGTKLLAEDVGNIALSPILCLSQDLAMRAGMKGFGMAFYLEKSESLYPVQHQAADDPPNFLDVAPWVVEIFDTHVMALRNDLSRVIEQAGQLIDANFSYASWAGRTESSATPVPATNHQPTLG